MTTGFYIVVGPRGDVDFRKTANFAVPAGHVATRIEVNIPDEAFDPMPVPTVVFNIPTNALRRVVEVEGEIRDPAGEPT